MQQDKVINKVARDLKFNGIVHEDDIPELKIHLNLVWTAGWEKRAAQIVGTRSRPVCQLNKRGKFINEFPNIRAAARVSHTDRNTISIYLNNKELTRQGHYWVYKEERGLPEQ